MRLEGVHGDMSFNHRCPAIFAGLASASTLVVPTDAQALTVGGVAVPELEQALPPRRICLLARREQPLSAAARELESMIRQAADIR